jgi:hypothetical protein
MNIGVPHGRHRPAMHPTIDYAGRVDRRAARPPGPWGLGQQVAAQPASNRSCPNRVARRSIVAVFLPLKLRGRGQDDVGRAFPCVLSTIPATIRAGCRSMGNCVTHLSAEAHYLWHQLLDG